MKPLPSKLRVYEAVFLFNRAFAFTIQGIERLEELGMFRRKYLRAFKVMAQELQSSANFEITETLAHREEDDWAHFGGLVRKWQKLFEDPRDVIVQAKQLEKRLAKQKQVQSTKKR